MAMNYKQFYENSKQGYRIYLLGIYPGYGGPCTTCHTMLVRPQEFYYLDNGYNLDADLCTLCYNTLATNLNNLKKIDILLDKYILIRTVFGKDIASVISPMIPIKSVIIRCIIKEHQEKGLCYPFMYRSGITCDKYHDCRADYGESTEWV